MRTFVAFGFALALSSIGCIAETSQDGSAAEQSGVGRLAGAGTAPSPDLPTTPVPWLPQPQGSAAPAVAPAAPVASPRGDGIGAEVNGKPVPERQ